MKKLGISDWIMWAVGAYLILGMLGVNVPGAEGFRCTPEAEARGGGICVSSDR